MRNIAAAFLLLTLGLCAGERVVEVTAYCPCKRCCGKWSGGPTASGKMPKQGVTVACNWLPFGTRVSIEGLGERIVQDRMSKRFAHRMD
ncbi:3D domain-containing protein, partial [Salmonella enterica]|uniref:3D domain-containing protein n=1 Tax=Salmonella enterica TaxID=28901 RepID=UPI003526AC82